jgi:predicted alpha/beta-fold hydrolase
VPVREPNYTPPWWLRNGHAQTVAGRFFRRVSLPRYGRVRIELADGDFLDLDTISRGHGRVAILVHGLESCAQAPYIRSMAKVLLEDSWDIVAVNLRGCSGEPNRLLRSYHSGVTKDLQAVISHVRGQEPEAPIALVGFSLGGNIVLRYLGEQGERVHGQGILLGAGISVPCELESCAERFARPENRIYMNRFLKLLFRKVKHRQHHFPDAMDYEAILSSKNFHDFDGQFTAPVHGFSSAQDYWTSCSANATARHIAIPTLLVNAEDDPFLTPGCHLLKEAENHPFLHTERTQHGGHVAFITGVSTAPYHEQLVHSFFERATQESP